ncbi:MAG: NTP transferase domain-containing protein [Desulfobulbus sp.]|nr:NTP transferase domain-containing protein [Desulfobulbus sp.]
MQAIILAAGYGTRLRPYTDIRPKPLFPVLNRPLLHLLLAQLQSCGCYPMVVNSHHLATQIEAALGAWPDVFYQFEPEILGTGGSLRKALSRFTDEPILVMNGDLYHRIDLHRVYRHHVLSENDVTLALHAYPRFSNVEVQGDRVSGFGCNGSRCLAFTGIHVIEPGTAARIPDGGFFHIIDLYRELAKEGRVGYCRVDGSLWRDIGTPADYLQLHEELLVQHGDPAWLIAPDARIGSQVVLQGWGCVGPGAVVGDRAQLSCSVVWDGAEVMPGSVHTQSIVTGHGQAESQRRNRG